MRSPLAYTRSLFSLTGQWPITCTFDNKCNLNHFKSVEERWKPILNEKWSQYSKEVDPTAPNFRYVLAMFPYPSGNLHLGHVRIYTTADVQARYYRLKGFSVSNPMGWDSFGLPAENAALERTVSPATWTYQNIDNMEDQIKSLGLNVNWREATSDPSFYRWTQWLFLQLFKSGLLFKSMSSVNWDPVDKTVLADDQVDADGKSWRSGAKVEKRFLSQWAVKISAFHEQIYESENINMDDPSWKELVLNQRFFLGPPESYIFYFPMGHDTLPVLCDYPEFLLDEQSFLAVNSDHWIRKEPAIKLVNPLTGKVMRIVEMPETDLPVSGRAIILNQSNPFCDVKRKQVLDKCVQSNLGGYRSSKRSHDWIISRQRYWGTPIPMINCPSCGTVPVNESALPIELPPVKDLNHLYDKSVSADAHAIESRLRAVAPKDWLNVTCPKCNSPSVRETDTIDTFFDSSWYYLRYATEPNNLKAFDPEAVRKPVHLYVGGAEHCRGHMLFARYIYKFLKSKGLIESNSLEPFVNILFLGYVLGKTIKLNGRFITESEYEQLCEEGVNSPSDFVETFEKMSKSKGNGINPLELVSYYGVDLTRLTLLGFGLPRRERQWHGHKVEYEEVFVILRRMFLTIDQFIYIRELKEETKKSPLIKRFTTVDVDDNKLTQILQNLMRERQRIIPRVTESFENHYPTQGVFSLKRFLIIVRKGSLIPEVSCSVEYQRCLGDIIIMLGPVLPHLMEECWAAFTKYADRQALDYEFDKLAMEQKWPTAD